MTFKNKKVYLALANPPAEKWLAAKMAGAEIKYHPGENSFEPDIVLVSSRSSIGSVFVGVDNPMKLVSRFVAHAPVVAVVADNIIPELLQAGIPEECFILPDDPGVSVRVSRVFSLLEDLVKKDLRIEPVVYGNPVELKDISEPVLMVPKTLTPELAEGSMQVFDFSALVPYRDRITIFSGPGVGKTTLAAAFTAHLSGLSEQVSAVDLGSPPALGLHMGNPELNTNDGWKKADTDWGTLYIPAKNMSPVDIGAFIGCQAQEGYVVVDMPSRVPEWIKCIPANFVDVIDDDMRTLKLLDFDSEHLLVANRVPSASIGTWPYVVDQTLGKKPNVIIEEDNEGVPACLDGYLPASSKSIIIAQGVSDIGRHLRALREGEA